MRRTVHFQKALNVYEIVTKEGSDNSVGENHGNSKQQTISTLSTLKSSDTLDSTHLGNDIQKVHPNNHGSSTKCVYSNLQYVKVIAGDKNDYKLHK